MQFTVRGLTQELADEVRRTGSSPGYGHPAHIEIASGTGPCRCCLSHSRPAATHACCSLTARRAKARSWLPARCSSTHSTAWPGPARDFRKHCERCRWPSKHAPAAAVSPRSARTSMSLPRYRSSGCLATRRFNGSSCDTRRPAATSLASIARNQQHLKKKRPPRFPAGASCRPQTASASQRLIIWAATILRYRRLRHRGWLQGRNRCC